MYNNKKSIKIGVTRKQTMLCKWQMPDDQLSSLQPAQLIFTVDLINSNIEISMKGHANAKDRLPLGVFLYNTDA